MLLLLLGSGGCSHGRPSAHRNGQRPTTAPEASGTVDSHIAAAAAAAAAVAAAAAAAAEGTHE